MAGTDKKLTEAHKHWHDCLNSYQEPDDFRISLNSCIQSLRNVTFALQYSKASIPGFDDWYLDQQEAMRADTKLRWMVEARNTIVKRGDLATKSTSLVTLVSNYDLETILADLEQLEAVAPLEGQENDEHLKTISVKPLRSWPDVFLELNKLDLPMKVRADCSVVMERRWVAEQFPNHELLGLLAHCYGALNQVVLKAHELLGLRAYEVHVTAGAGVQPVSKSIELEVLPHGGRLPCMISTRLVRSARFRLLDGSAVDEGVFFRAPIESDPGLISAAADRYGLHPRYPGPVGKVEPRPLVEWMAKVAVSILKSGEDHGWFVNLYRDGHLIEARVLMAADAPDKHVLAAQVAQRVDATQADMVSMVGESWMSPRTTTPDGSFIPPRLHPDRRECVTVSAEHASGASSRALVYFETISGEPPNRVVAVSEPIMANDYVDMFFGPTREVWRRRGLRGKHERGASFFKRPTWP